MYEFVFLFQPTQTKTNHIAYCQTNDDDDSTVVEENALNPSVCRAKRFERANHIRSFQNQNEQSCDHIDDGNNKHQYQNDLLIDILQVEPIKNGRFFLANCLRR